MRAMPIKVYTGKGGLIQMKASFKKNWIHYLQEALGLAIFMISACFFSALLWGDDASFHFAIDNVVLRNIITGLLMGFTALFIFYSPFTAPSGSHINPAVTFTFLRLNKMCPWDAMFYVIFQFTGGTIAVYIMAALLGNVLTAAPVNYAVTLPGKNGVGAAAITEYIIAIIMITMVLFTSEHTILKKYTRIIAGCLVCIYVILAGPISGFGMNPARSFASAVPAHIYTAFWIYMIVPFAGMLSAAEFFLLIKKVRLSKENKTLQFADQNRDHQKLMT
ncbi:MAG: aquaporin [Ginsengibacter sp.]